LGEKEKKKRASVWRVKRNKNLDISHATPLTTEGAPVLRKRAEKKKKEFNAGIVVEDRRRFNQTIRGEVPSRR